MIVALVESEEKIEAIKTVIKKARLSDFSERTFEELREALRIETSRYNVLNELIKEK